VTVAVGAGDGFGAGVGAGGVGEGGMESSIDGAVVTKNLLRVKSLKA
jgi:hypothetical protein